MVIERALERIKQEAQAKLHAAPANAATAEAIRPRPTAGGHPPGAAAAVPIGPGAPRPDWPVLAPDEGVCERSRVILPTLRSAAAHPDAAYRMLRTRLTQALRTRSWNTISVTSPGPSEGKSLTALNLALSLARDVSHEVFLIDLDMRNPSMCRYLGVSPPVEIIHYMSGRVAPEAVLFSIGVDNLVLAGGLGFTEAASELIGSERLEMLIAYIKSISARPIILLDLPPVLLTDEALLVAPRIDATLLVVSEGRTNRESLTRTKQLLQGFDLAGVVLNLTSETFGADSYQYGYGYGYGAK
jgi:protein-tyrosine kinase